jgi:putative endonuclease
MNATNVAKNRATKQIGSDAEKLALSFLQSSGLKLINRNFTCKYGEIDLIMQHQDFLVFVEVRFRTHPRFGTGADSVDHRKQQKILKTAEFFLQRHVNYNQNPCRIDIVSIGPGKNDINWITNAVEA